MSRSEWRPALRASRSSPGMESLGWDEASSACPRGQSRPRTPSRDSSVLQKLLIRSKSPLRKQTLLRASVARDRGTPSPFQNLIAPGLPSGAAGLEPDAERKRAIRKDAAELGFKRRRRWQHRSVSPEPASARVPPLHPGSPGGLLSSKLGPEARSRRPSSSSSTCSSTAAVLGQAHRPSCPVSACQCTCRCALDNDTGLLPPLSLGRLESSPAGAAPCLGCECSALVKLLVLGGKQVGKSALTVRYLTKRFIGEYQSNEELCYRQKVSLEGGQTVEVEIVDVSDMPNIPFRLPVWRLRTSDACVVIYSVTDRASLRAAAEALDTMHSLRPPVDIPILLMANKVDLKHLRKVSTAEGVNLSRKYNTSFQEVSVADSPVETIEVMNKLVRSVWREKLIHHRHMLLQSPPGIPVSPLCGDVLPAPDSPCLSEPATSSFSRSGRKMTAMWNDMGKVFSSLMLGTGNSSSGSGPSSSSSRHRNASVPPELPSSLQSRLSLKKVFKKRSV